MTEQDQMSAHILGRLYAIEAVLMLLTLKYDSDSGIKKAIEDLLENAESLSLFQPTSEAEREIFRQARAKSYRAIFRVPEQDS